MTSKKNKPTPKENAGRLAKKAAEIIENTGWVSGILKTDEGRVCIRGAMSKVRANGKTLPVEYSHEAEAKIIGAWFKENVPVDDAIAHSGKPLNLSIVDDSQAIVTYNDTVFKSQEETVAWLRKAGEDLDRK